MLCYWIEPVAEAVKGGDGMLGDRLNSCLLFTRATCPRQAPMERAYLIPQLMSAVKLTFLQQTCMDCKLFKPRQRVLSLSALSTWVSPTRGAELSLKSD